MIKYPKLCESGWVWLWIAPLIIGIDQFTKQLMQNSLLPYAQRTLAAFFNLTLAFNRGAAFSFLNDTSAGLFLFGALAIIISAGLLVWLRKISVQQVLLSVGITFVIGGALANLIDRIHYGYVIDFLDFHIGGWHWPTFNVADSFICLGAGLLFLDALKNKN